MKITRWQAPVTPSKDQVASLFINEGLDPVEETLPAKQKVPEHRHPFSEIRVVVSGEMLFNIAGNQVLLRPGDRLEVPANTRHSQANNSEQPCHCICSERSY